ncbi:MAG: hypothetical protein KDD02_26210 [Phaeodactylibacter sp.]|nr:hypothetical protein [Phaeodactylibacter sp.]MCB9299227.1 hypothetical protein [Lewinellaceae bacterium]
MSDELAQTENNDKPEIGEMTAPIDDYLLGIADSLQRVQRQLNNTKVLSVDGMSYTTYQLPKLEFELKMSIQLSASSEDSDKKVFRAKPVGGQSSGSRSSEVEQASVIKGAFVAVPSDLGKPPPIPRTLVQELESGDFNVIINVQSVIGEPQAGIAVHYNIDRPLSEKLTNGLDGNKGKGVKVEWDKIYFDHALVNTDKEGNAFSKLTVDSSIKTRVAVIIDVLGKTETLVIDGTTKKTKVSNEEAAKKALDLIDHIKSGGSIFGLGGLFGR